MASRNNGAAGAGAALDWLARNATSTLAVGAFGGLLWPALAAALRPALVPLVFAIVALALARLDWQALADAARRPVMAAASLAFILAGAPVALALALAALPLPGEIESAVLLAHMSAPVFASVAVSMFLGLDAALAVLLAVAAHFLLPFTLPPIALWLLGLELSIELLPFMARLGAFVGGAALMGLALRRGMGPARLARHGKRLDGMAVAIFLVFSVAVMDGVAALAVDDPGFVLAVLAASTFFNAMLQAIGTALFWPLGAKRAMTVGLLAGNRNMALLLAVLGDAEPFRVLVYFAVGQIPIFVLPWLMAPLYRRLLRRA